MPLYHFICTTCGDKSRRLLEPEEVENQMCGKCLGKHLDRNPQPPTTQVMETLDNGLMPRRLERFSDAERLHKDRSKLH